MAVKRKVINVKPDSEKRVIRKYLFVAVILVLGLLSYFILKGFLVAIISAFVIAYLLMPLNLILSRKMPRSISSLICILLPLLFFFLISYFVINIIIEQLKQLSENFSSAILLKLVSDLPYLEVLHQNSQDIVSNTFGFLISLISSVSAYIPSFLFAVFISLFAAYYLLIDWENFWDKVQSALPFNENKLIMDKISRTASNIIRGIMLIALIEFVLALIGFKIAEVPFYALFAFLIAIFAFIPLLGPAAVWVPLAAFMLFQQNYFSFFGVLITGLVLSGLVDGLLSSLLVGKVAKINPVILLLGVLGGVKLFGIFGFVIGPLILGLFIDLVTGSLFSSRQKGL